MKQIQLSFVLIIILLSSCGEEMGTVELDKLPGRWTLVEAQRDGNVTSTLDNAFFDIDSEVFSHNLNGDSVGVSYVLESNVLKLNDEMLKTLEVTALNADTLRAKTKIGSFNFQFLMTRNESN